LGKSKYDTKVLPWKEFCAFLQEQLSSGVVRARAAFINVLFDSMFSGRYIGLDGGKLYKATEFVHGTASMKIGEGDNFCRFLPLLH